MSLVKNKMTEACSKLYGQNAYMVELTVHSSSEEMFIHHVGMVISWGLNDGY